MRRSAWWKRFNDLGKIKYPCLRGCHLMAQQHNHDKQVISGHIHEQKLKRNTCNELIHQIVSPILKLRILRNVFVKLSLFIYSYVLSITFNFVEKIGENMGWADLWSAGGFKQGLILVSLKIHPKLLCAVFPLDWLVNCATGTSIFYSLIWEFLSWSKVVPEPSNEFRSVLCHCYFSTTIDCKRTIDLRFDLLSDCDIQICMCYCYCS